MADPPYQQIPAGHFVIPVEVMMDPVAFSKCMAVLAHHSNSQKAQGATPSSNTHSATGDMVVEQPISTELSSSEMLSKESTDEPLEVADDALVPMSNDFQEVGKLAYLRNKNNPNRKVRSKRPTDVQKFKEDSRIEDIESTAQLMNLKVYVFIQPYELFFLLFFFFFSSFKPETTESTLWSVCVFGEYVEVLKPGVPRYHKTKGLSEEGWHSFFVFLILSKGYTYYGVKNARIHLIHSVDNIIPYVEIFTHDHME